MSALAKIKTELQDVVGPGIEVLVDAGSPDFQEYAKRWTDIDRKTPAAIVLPTSEEEIQKIVSLWQATIFCIWALQKHAARYGTIR